MADQPRRKRSGDRSAPTPAKKAFGEHLRGLREKLKIKQAALAAATNVTESAVSKIENGRHRPSPDFVEKADKYLNASGSLVRLWDNLSQDGYPASVWFDWQESEEHADILESYQLSVLSGLAQTRAYMAVLLKGDVREIEKRLARQAVLTREEPRPPQVVFLVDEQVLYRQVGTEEIMREQLEHLLALSDLPNVTVQIVRSSGDHQGNGSSFVVGTMDDAGQVAYVENSLRGFTVDDRHDLTVLHGILIELRANALPVDQSREFIRKVIAERWT
ncbi:helix-turn-helix domain-containing protein [Actinomadura rubteroloni]|uniref:helix-turn-helix domain-containing protein n=1 Tax=Actinomadura rubteroloni TaxID=1926885 RepID=UPI00143D434D|nr:helix-turn-helix transcriptional regulator [Actinomadura rubteroloni]